PFDPRAALQSDPDLVHKRRWLQSRLATLPAHDGCGPRMQVGVDQWHQLVAGLQVASARPQQQVRDVEIARHEPRILAERSLKGYLPRGTRQAQMHSKFDACQGAASPPGSRLY